jgi:hypothetical protein
VEGKQENQYFATRKTARQHPKRTENETWVPHPRRVFVFAGGWDSRNAQEARHRLGRDFTAARKSNPRKAL